MRWREGEIHLAMRKVFRDCGWQLIAGEFPGGSDHELYPLNIVDPVIARDNSPDPRRHSQGELIPDLVALKGRVLAIAEAKVLYDKEDHKKLEALLSTRRADLATALEKFARERRCANLLPVVSLEYAPVLVFAEHSAAPEPTKGMSYLRIANPHEGRFEGKLK